MSVDKLPKLVKCVNADFAAPFLIRGNTYTVVDRSEPGRRIQYALLKDEVGDNTNPVWWDMDRFVDTGCPCSIKNCLTHR